MPSFFSASCALPSRCQNFGSPMWKHHFPYNSSGMFCTIQRTLYLHAQKCPPSQQNTIPGLLTCLCPRGCCLHASLPPLFFAGTLVALQLTATVFSSGSLPMTLPPQSCSRLLPPSSPPPVLRRHPCHHWTPPAQGSAPCLWTLYASPLPLF